jgi:hypothetical protein
MGMRDAAEPYCRVIEAAAGSDRSTFVSDAGRTLAAAIAAAYRLPDLEWTSSVDTDGSTETITHEQWSARFGDIQGVLGEWGTYWIAAEAYRIDEATHEPELRDGLDALDRGTPESEVDWEWRFGFRTHWGAHAVNALRALHQQLTA